jgi:hypothetical protein
MVVSATGIKQQRPLRERSIVNAFHAEVAESMHAEIADYIILYSPRLCASAAKKSFFTTHLHNSFWTLCKACGILNLN